MKDKIKEYINFIFRNAPNTLEAMELKDEITNDVILRYEKLVNEDIDEETAFAQAISNIGNIDELISELRKGEDKVYMETSKISMENNIKLNILKSFAVFLLIISPVSVIIFDDSRFGIFLLFFCIATGVGMLIFVNQIKKVQPVSITTDFKQYRKENEISKISKLLRGITLTSGVIAYFLVSFLTGAWHITWIIFIIVGLCNQLLELVLLNTDNK